MSNSAAIAAVTAAFRNLLAEAVSHDPELADTVFTMQAPDIARADGVTANQINLFLFRTAVNAAWSNAPISERIRPGEEAPPPLALTLSYLLTAYGRDNDAQRPFSHLLLGRAMGALHDNPILTPEALRASLPEVASPRQIERVRITMQPMNLEDLSKLWSTFQTQYRLSTTYEASMVLIESNRPVRAPLPVLRRSSSGGGVITQADTSPPMPILLDVQPNAAIIGDTVTLRGIHLAGDGVVVRLTRDGQSWELSVEPGVNPEQVAFVVPGDRGLGAGLYSVCVDAGAADRMIASNTMALAIMPRLVSRLPMTVRNRTGGITVEVEVSPPVLPGQVVALLLGSRETRGAQTKAAQSRLRFAVPAIEPGVYVLRLRVDGVDSPVIRVHPDAPPEFDPAARLTVTA
jgi:hypothetical protein